MKALIFTALLLIVVYPLLGQVEPYDLSQYKTPDFSLRGLDFNFDVKGNLTSEQSNAFLGNPEKNDNYTSNRFYGSGRYRFYRNSRKYQTSYGGWLHLSPRLLTTRSTRMTFEPVNTIGNMTDVNFYYNTKYYYKPKKSIEISLSQGNRYDYEFRNVLDSDKDNTKLLFINHTDLSFLHGHGRIESVSHAWKAYKIYEELAKLGLLSQNSISNEDITALADLLVTLSNTRYYDYRLRIKSELRTVFNHLKKDLTGDDIESFTVINDMFYNGNSYFRSVGGSVLKWATGSRFYYGIKTSFNFRSLKNNESLELTRENGAFLTLGYDNYKPININWHRSYHVGVDFGTHEIDATFDNSYDLLPNLSYSLGYFPNLRTSIVSKASVTSMHHLPEHGDFDYKFSYHNLSAKIVSDFYYYISPMVRWDFNLGLTYVGFKANLSTFGMNKSSKFDFVYGAGLKYFIF